MTNAKILIVEDEPISASVIQKKLKSLGYAITGVVSFGEEAIEKAAELHPDLVLMDIVLKGKMDGIEAAEKIRSSFDIPVIYLTACADENTLQRAKITEPYGYILKPCEERELHTSIEMALYRHQMERKLKESKQWLVTVLRGIGDAVIAADKNGLVSFMNPVAEELTGWKHTDALGIDLSNVFNVIKESAEAAAQAVKEGIKMQSNHTVLITKDGRQRFIDYNTSPLRDDKGETWGVVLVFRDITERMRLEKEILDAKTEVELYLDIMSHDINNLNQICIGYLELLLDDEKLDGVQKNYATESLESVRGSIKLISHVNLLKQIKGKPTLNEIDLNKVIIEVINEFSTNPHKKVSINYNPKVGLNVNADPLIKEIPVNLIGNSIKYSGETVEISVAVEETVRNGKEFYKVCIEDNGDGVPDEKKQTIFRRLERGTKKASGKGLGLYIVKMLMEKYGGEIWVEDRVKGNYRRGARFCFAIPKAL